MSTERVSCVPAGIRQALEAQIAAGKDNPLARLTLGRVMFSEDDFDGSIRHLKRAIELDSEYSAAYSALAKAYARSGDVEKAIEIYTKGEAVASKKGDLQAARQMEVMKNKLVRKNKS